VLTKAASVKGSIDFIYFFLLAMLTEKTPQRLPCESRRHLPVIRTMSGPGRKDFFRRRNLFRRTGKVEFEFSSPADDLDLDGFQAVFLHSQAELSIDFLDAVLLEAFAHGRVSVRDSHKAMLFARLFQEDPIRPNGQRKFKTPMSPGYPTRAIGIYGYGIYA
jgi:hypothetical protein